MKLLSELTAAQHTEVRKAALLAGFGRLAFGRFGEQGELTEKGGNVYRMWRIPAFTVPATPVELAGGETPAETAYTLSYVDITPKWYGAFSWIPTEVKVQSILDLVSRLGINFGIYMAELVETLTKNVVTVGTAVQYASTATARNQITNAMPLSTAEVIEAVTTLEENKAQGYPNAAMRKICIIHPRQKADLQKDSDFKNSLLYAKERGDDNPLFDGLLADYLGVRFFVSDFAPKYAGEGAGSANVYGALMMGYQAYGLGGVSGYMIDQLEGGTENEDEVKNAVKLITKSEEQIGGPLEVKSSIGTKCTHGSVICIQTWMVRIETGSSLG